MSRWRFPQVATRRAEMRRRQQRRDLGNDKAWLVTAAVLAILGFAVYLFLYAKVFVHHSH